MLYIYIQFEAANEVWKYYEDLNTCWNIEATF